MIKLILKKIFMPLCILSIPFPGISGTDDNSATTRQPLHKWVKFDGVIKTKWETSIENGAMRFNVRNSRLGLHGGIGEYVAYRVQVEFSNEGNFSPLDLYGTLKPAKGLNISFGQTSIPFENQYIISPAEMMFSNRAFVGKYFTPGSRDIGVAAKYALRLGTFPLEGEAGMFNGGRINDPQWTDEPSYAARLAAGGMDGFRASVKFYRYNSEASGMFLWGADAHYANDYIRVEAEVMNRRFDGRNLSGAYIQGAYMFGFGNSRGMLHSASPAFRWDAMGYDLTDSGFDVNRLTFGINFGLDLKPFDSTLRLDCERYFLRDGHFDEFDNRDPHAADNKVTIELVLRF